MDFKIKKVNYNSLSEENFKQICEIEESAAGYLDLIFDKNDMKYFLRSESYTSYIVEALNTTTRTPISMNISYSTLNQQNTLKAGHYLLKIVKNHDFKGFFPFYKDKKTTSNVLWLKTAKTSQINQLFSEIDHTQDVQKTAQNLWKTIVEDTRHIRTGHLLPEDITNPWLDSLSYRKAKRIPEDKATPAQALLQIIGAYYGMRKQHLDAGLKKDKKLFQAYFKQANSLTPTAYVQENPAFGEALKHLYTAFCIAVNDTYKEPFKNTKAMLFLRQKKARLEEIPQVLKRQQQIEYVY